jgi:norsolorinic acid ketoreductase
VGVGMGQAPISVEDGVSGVVAQTDNAAQEGTSGTFVAFDRKPFAW